MSRITNKRLTEQQFKAVVKHLSKGGRASPGPKPTVSRDDIAYAALVVGTPRVEIAKKWNVHRQHVDAVANHYYDFYFTEIAGLPDSWKTTVVHGSPAFIKKVKELEEQEHKAFLQAKQKRKAK